MLRFPIFFWPEMRVDWSRPLRVCSLAGFLAMHLLWSAFGAGAAGASTNSEPTTSDWIVRSWRTSDGLPQNTVNALVQTRDGYLWVGTSGGLGRFDGVRFRNFGLEDGLGSVQITSLLEDRTGVLWVGTSSGLSRWEKGRFRSFGATNGFPTAAVLSLVADRENTLWIGTEKSLSRFKN